MLERTNKQLTRRLLIVDDQLEASVMCTRGRALHDLVAEFRRRGVEVVEARSFDDGQAAIVSDAGLHGVFVDWTLGQNDVDSHALAIDLMRTVRRRNANIPIFLTADRESKQTLSTEALELADEFVWLLEDTAPFIAGRAMSAMDRYLAQLLPPFTHALLNYTGLDEYSWAAPGHQGGIAFTKSPVGRVFFDFFGENLFRTDTGIERTRLGSLLDHSGPIREAEDYAARVFGAHASYSVLNGTSASNRVVFMACVGEGQFALCDRNCHKSVEQGLVLTGGIPVYFPPTRNRYGIIGPILPQQLTPAAIGDAIAHHPLAADASGAPDYAVITNCTYDGMCLHAERTEALLAESVDRIHFDEAWFGYARFNPMYRDRFAMRGDPAAHPADGPTVFATHSTHKLLAALSQASYIHVRNGRKPIEHSRFNESYVIQASTSPMYALLASNEIGAAMMDGPGGQTLTQDVIQEAIDFRQALARTHREFANRGDWFFAPWNAPTITDPNGVMLPFADADPELLANDPRCWTLKPGDTWHGFEGLEDDWCLLDPIKAGILMPGMGEDGTLERFGIPAAIVSAYLYRNNIIPSRATDFMILCLFTMGVTKGKWGTLISVLLSFKRHHDANAPLAAVLPDLVAAHPARYKGLGVADLAREMFAHMRQHRMDQLEARAFGSLPAPVTTPRRAFQRLQAGDAELLPLDAAVGRTTAVGIIPYPPGIPIVMPGESLGPANGPWLRYIRAIQDWGRAFPGFEREVEGAVERDGLYHFWCLRED